MNKIGAWFLMLAAAALPLTRACACADETSLFYRFDQVFNGSTPDGTAPWLTASFVDVTPGTVVMTLNADGLAEGEIVKDAYFNLDPTLSAGIKKLRFVYQSGSAGLHTPNISTGKNAFAVDGAGSFDIKVNFNASRKNSFGPGDFLSFKITGISGLTASDFGKLSFGPNSAQTYFAAAHILSRASENPSANAWISPSEMTSVPEPAGLSLWAMSGVLCFVFRKRISGNS